MEERVEGYGGRPPIWCWLEKPDMRGIWGPGGVRVVRAALEIPAERVLVSDFELWHVPLNNNYLARSDAEDRAFEDEENRRGFWRARHETPSGWWTSPDSDYPSDLRERVLRSWERVFPDRWGELDESEWYGVGDGRDRRLQACVEEIRPEDVVRQERFVTRRGA